MRFAIAPLKRTARQATIPTPDSKGVVANAKPLKAFVRADWCGRNETQRATSKCHIAACKFQLDLSEGLSARITRDKSSSLSGANGRTLAADGLR